jgi:glycosyltransferase involved in cell wall biosynthesis
MKIIHLTPDLNFAIKFVLPIADIQSVDGNEVTIFTHLNEYAESEHIAEDLESRYPEIHFIKLNIKARLNLISYLKSLLRLISELISIRPDIIIFHTSIDSFVPLMVSRVLIKNAKLVYFNHGVPFLGYGFPLHSIFKLVEAINLRSAQLSLTIGRSMRESLVHLAPRNNDVFLVNPGSACGVQLISTDYDLILRMRTEARKALGISNNELVVIYVGRAVKRKGFYDLLEAWNVFEGRRDYRLLLLGPSETDRARISGNISANVHFLGYQSDPNPFYLVADVLCIPSYHEGLGYCYLEASAAGCVSICCNIPGPTDFIRHGETGITCTCGDPQSIADSISQLLCDNKFRDYLAKNAFSQAITFDRSTLAPKIVDAIRSN